MLKAILGSKKLDGTLVFHVELTGKESFLAIRLKMLGQVDSINVFGISGKGEQLLGASDLVGFRDPLVFVGVNKSIRKLRVEVGGARAHRPGLNVWAVNKLDVCKAYLLRIRYSYRYYNALIAFLTAEAPLFVFGKGLKASGRRRPRASYLEWRKLDDAKMVEPRFPFSVSAEPVRFFVDCRGISKAAMTRCLVAISRQQDEEFEAEIIIGDEEKEQVEEILSEKLNYDDRFFSSGKRCPV